MQLEYIGVTGFINRQQVEAALDKVPYACKRRLMVGIPASSKSLAGIPLSPKWANQTPPTKDIYEIFTRDPRALNLVHYSHDSAMGLSALEELEQLYRIAKPNINGFQLNMVWPEPTLLKRFGILYLPMIILQIGQKAMELAGSPKGVAERLEDYSDLITGVLIDASGGHGKPLDTEKAREYLRAISNANLNLSLGVAGGLGPDTLYLVEPLLEEFPNISIDAQGRLQDGDNGLHIGKMQDYLRQACEMFRNLRK